MTYINMKCIKTKQTLEKKACGKSWPTSKTKFAFKMLKKKNRNLT